MSDRSFQSSDSVRSSRSLLYAREAQFPFSLTLEMGGVLPEFSLCYETYGRLNEKKDNAILICHALSGDSHVARHDGRDDPGWWDIAVGPGKCMDTEKYFLICPNVLGGCRGTTGPNSLNPEAGQPYGQDFPTITIGDMVEAQRHLVDHLGIDRLLAVIGGSMGGMQVLQWATHYPDRVQGAVAIATASRLTTQGLAFDVIARNAIRRDPFFFDGNYYHQDNGPQVGLALARMLGHITYLSPESMRKKFGADRLSPRDVQTQFEKTFSVGSYLAYQGDRFVERFDANSYLTLSMAMDLFDLGDGCDELAANLQASRCKWMVISYSSDWLFPPEQSRRLVDALLSAGKQVSYCNVASSCGHDAFLLADNLSSYGELIRSFLHNLNSIPLPAKPTTDESTHNPTSIFHAQRLDHQRLAELIPVGSSVLDLGCGRGSLLALLQQKGYRQILGVELDEQAVLSCVRKGVPVIHADLNLGLKLFTDQQFDFVILSQTLQAIKDVERVVMEMLRVSQRAIVSFPNFAYSKLRTMLCEQGKAPISLGLLRYQWYNTPNIRFLTISDFEDFCRDQDIIIHHRICLDTEAGVEIVDNPNLYADMAIYTLSR
jgi:homoserine O-acetyltransferase/O-succinyltransferase